MLGIRGKIISGFVSIFVIGMIIGVYGLYSINKISAMSVEQASIQNASTEISSVLAAHYGWRQNLTVSVFSDTEFTGTYDPDNCALGKWRNSDGAKATADDKILSLLEQIDEPHRLIHSEAKTVMDLIAAGHTEEAQNIFMGEILPHANTAISRLSEMTEEYKTMLEKQTSSIVDFQAKTLNIIIGLIVFATVLCVFLAIAITRSILKPIKTLAKSADLVAAGNFSVSFKHSVNDEIGKLTNSFATLVNTFRTLIGDMSTMAKNHSAGEIECFIDGSHYSGEFQDVVQGINSMIKEYVDDTMDIVFTTQKYAEGDFNAKLKTLPGQKAAANTIFDAVTDNLQNVERSVMSLVNAALNGRLDERIDDTDFKGGWKEIVAGMNKLLEAVDAPLVEAQEILSLVSIGKLDVKITGKYNGQFEKMSMSINKTIEVLSLYISEISVTLNKMASDNFDIAINREYVGSFNDIKTSLCAIIDRLNSVMGEIGSAADQVAAGAGQISETSMMLSQGATEQASSVEELNAAIVEIKAKTIENAENTTTANSLVTDVKNDAEQGNNEMKGMLASMTEINSASQDISKIIKVIEDIAFQTNLLALNAAVEAARAGEHGKGFAVVAEEVRNLAARSQSSAKETAGLIEHSMMKVREGTKIANETAAALIKIVGGIEQVSDIIGKIEISSKEQAAAIVQINEGIGQISHVTQENSATSEESAAAAEELSSQSEMLKSMIGRFELRR